MESSEVLGESGLVSIIVPVYNRARMIPRSVGSLLSQSYRDIEVILVDDNSTDAIEEAVATFDDPRLRLIRRDVNGGASAARNDGIAAARGALIAFHDSDDVAVFDKIELQVALLQSLPAGYIGVHSAAVTHLDLDEADRARARATVRPPPDRSPLSGDMYEPTLQNNVVNLPTMLLKREAVLAAGPFDTRLRNNNDWDFTLRLTRLGPMGFVPLALYIFSIRQGDRSGGGNISRMPWYSVRSFVRVTGKLRRHGHTADEIGHHYIKTATLLIRAGRQRFARRFLLAARRARPLSLRPNFLMIFTILPPEVYRRFWEFRNR